MPYKEKQKFSLKRFLPSRLFLIIGVVILILFSVALGKEVVRRYEVNREVIKLKKEIEELEKRNAEVSELIQYFNTDSYKEEEARIKLGLAKPGEKVIVIPNIKAEKPNEEETKTTNQKIEELSNPQRWWYYFFNH